MGAGVKIAMKAVDMEGMTTAQVDKGVLDEASAANDAVND
jgi:hypothetical protein